MQKKKLFSIGIVAGAGSPEFSEQPTPIDFDYKIQYLSWKILPPRLFSYACHTQCTLTFKNSTCGVTLNNAVKQ